jgi:cytochrome c553
MKAFTGAIAVVLSLAASAIAVAQTTATAQADQNAETLATHVCSNCHGAGGDSKSPTFPRLAAQQAPYIAAQIKAFRANTRGEQEAHDYMLGMVALFDDATAEALGRYFARQPAAHGTPGDPKLVAEGGKLFAEGAGVQGIPACAACHGADAHGNGIFPRLAGQHAQYIVKQLNAIQSQTRKSPVMHGIIKNLTPAQLNAVAVYLQSLG